MKAKPSESGQALVEFMLTMPMLLMLLWYMMHVNVAINKSIVGQKHARSHVFLRLMNHANGPQETFDMTNLARSAYFLGISEQVLPASGDIKNQRAPVEVLGVGFKPKPSTSAGVSDDPGEPVPGSLRQNIRIRTAFGLCTPRKLVRGSTDTLTDYCAKLNNN